jgi:hypothetical protein
MRPVFHATARGLCAAVLLGLALATASLAVPPTIERVAGSAGFTIEGAITDLSGLVWMGGDSFIAVSDKRAALLPVTLRIDRATGAIASGEFGAPIPVPTKRQDFEGVAYVAASRRFFIATETPAGVLSFRRGDREVRTLSLPPVFAGARRGLALESLTWDAKAGRFWTANEEALERDGAVSGPDAGTIVRLQAFDAEFRALAQYAWRTEPATMRVGAGCGVADLLVLADGTLLVLERGFAGFGLAVRLYAAELKGATDVTRLAALEGAAFTPAGKKLLSGAEASPLKPRSGDGHVVVLQRPLAHETNTLGDDAIDDELGIVGRAEVAAEQGIRLPDFREHGRVGEHFGATGDAHLIVRVVQVAQLDARVRGDLGGLAVAAEIRDEDGEAIDADRGDGAHARLVAIDGGEHGKFRAGDHGAGEGGQVGGVDRRGSGHGGRSCVLRVEC